MPIEFQTKEEILQALVAVAEKLGRPPSRSEFRRETGVSEYTILKHFLSWNDAVAPLASGYKSHRFSWLEITTDFSWDSNSPKACKMGTCSKSVRLRTCRIS